MPLDIAKAYPENGSLIYGTVTSINCFIVVLMTPILTMVLEKVSLTKKFALGVFMQTLSFFSFLLSFGIIAGYYFSISLFTLGEILVTVVVGTFLSQRVPASYRGRIYGITSFSSAFLSGIIKWGSGKLFDNMGLSYAWTFSIFVTAIAMVAAVIIIFTDRKEFSELYQSSNNEQIKCSKLKITDNDIVKEES